MCGRFTLRTPAHALAEAFATPPLLDEPARFNIAPSQDILIVRAGDDGRRQWAKVRWGLIPSWAKDPAIGHRLINARAETVAEKPSFRAAVRRRRCLVPADGYYEWAAMKTGKRPYHLALPGRRVFAIAGLWEQWKSPKGTAVVSATLITTAANQFLMPIHDRMPAILPADRYGLWLESPSTVMALDLVRPYAGDMVAQPVGSAVNNPRNDGTDLLAPISPAS